MLSSIITAIVRCNAYRGDECAMSVVFVMVVVIELVEWSKCGSVWKGSKGIWSDPNFKEGKEAQPLNKRDN